MLLPVLCAAASAQTVTTPHAIAPNISIRPYFQADQNAIRVVIDPVSGRPVYADSDGSVYRIVPITFDSLGRELLCSAEHHGMNAVTGIAFDGEGRLFLVGNRFVDSSSNIATIKRAPRPSEGKVYKNWSTVAQTVPYPRSNTNYDHTFNGIVVSPDGSHIYVNSGSRTDHGELQTNNGLYPGLREIPLTSAIFQLPADGTDILLENDVALLRSAGYLYADGTRNSFDLAFNVNGDLLAPDNSGDRDDSEELNWIREGHHYGFPWRMGMHDTPQQFPGYDPSKDLLVNKESYGSLRGFYYNDPTYPPPPPGLVFTEPIPNIGPAAVKYRDSATGAIMSVQSPRTLGTFTAHRSPLGLVFDVAGAMPLPYHHGGFVTSWTDGRPGGSELLTPFDEPGQDLIHLALTKGDEGYIVQSVKIAEGFNQPIDAAIQDNRIYVLDYAGTHTIWEVMFNVPGSVATERTSHLTPPSPNPCTERSRFAVNVPHAGHLTVELFDILGRPARNLYDAAAPAGERWFTVEAAGLAAGSYTIRVAGEGVRESIPIVIVR